MKLFFVVGEDSGDALAAPLIKALKEEHGSSVECMGVGGGLMKDEGFDELLPMDQIAVIGIWEVLPKIPRLIKLNKSIVEEIEKQQPDAVITVDFPDFNFILAKSLKKRGIFEGKIIHYVAPSVWAWRPERAKNISKFMDGIMCLFPMEVDYFTKHGMKAEHVGHPLVYSGANNHHGSEFRKSNKIHKDTKIIGLFFGSRESEFKTLSPILKEATLLIDDVEKDICVVAPTLEKFEYDVQKILEGFKLPVYIVANPNMKWEAFKSCDIAIAVSGTVALELAYAGVPHIITYKINPITALILKFLVKIKNVHLANILLEKDIVPEYLQKECNPEKIAEEIVDLLHNEEKKNIQKKEFLGLEDKLNNKEKISPSKKAAQFIMDIIKSKEIESNSVG